MNSASVRFSWTPVNLTVVYHYTVHYTKVGGVSDTVTLSDTVSSGVVSEDSSTSSVSLLQSISLESCTLDLLITHYHQKHVCELDLYGRYSITTYFLCVCITFFSFNNSANVSNNKEVLFIFKCVFNHYCSIISTDMSSYTTCTGSSSGLLAGLVIGWILFIITLVGCFIIITILVYAVDGRCQKLKCKCACTCQYDILLIQETSRIYR